MPKGGRARGRKEEPTQTPASAVAQDSRTELEQPHRPRTRAWTKQQQSVEKNLPKEVAPGLDQPHLPHKVGPVKQQQKVRKNVQKSAREIVERRPYQPRRPGTRAWERQQAEKNGQETKVLQDPRDLLESSRGTRKAPAAKPRPKTKQTRQEPQRAGIHATQHSLQKTRSGEPKRQRLKSKASTRKGTKPKRKLRGRPQITSVVSQSSPVRGESRTPQNPGLGGWLERVESVSPERTARARVLYTAPVPGGLPEEEPSMHESSSSMNTGEEISTAKEKGSRATKISGSKLAYRRIYQEASPDEKLEYLLSIIKITLPKLLNEEIEDLQSVAQHYLDETSRHPKDNCYPYIDDFSYDFDKAKSKINYPFINERYFISDLKRCLSKNEAVLQRTIMIHIINQYWLGEIFDWNSEGLWSQPEDTRLPSSKADALSAPKPDLAMFFTRKSFTGEAIDDPIPNELERCISPDGEQRCFPFLFMEVKKAGADLQDAFIANLHSASQALYNMYIWMVRVEQHEEFFKDVRVFSLVFNAQDLSVRVHRAEKRENDMIFFRFDELLPLQRYTKDQACLLIKTTVVEYVAKELHPVLKATFKKVINQEREQALALLAKRKAQVQGNSASKRAKRQNSLPHTGQSFSMSALSTH